MGLYLSENIKKNRRESNLSQEAFAERLGVSFQTISKWERGECYPDIEMLPKIANFFGITIDALMGADQYQEKEYVDTLQEELRKCDIMRDEAALVKKAEEGLRKYPNNHLIMAWIVYGAQNINPKRSIELGEYLMSNCRNQHILNWARTELCYAYYKAGRQNDGIESASRLPTMAQTRQAVLSDLLTGEKQLSHILGTDTAKACYRFKTSILKLLDHYTPQEQIELLKKSNAFYDVVYEREDNVSALKEKADTYIKIAEIYMNLENADEARLYVEKALICAEKHDAIPYGTPCESILSGCKKYGYSVAQSGKLAHPYGKLKEAIIASLKANPIFGDIVSKIE
ncbi:MAG: helix-turn-helix transcriptional regulator [Clostridia bacterium]|nr:helix-turn-helix transcriptional regulator [Clostridia bacterium]MBQ3228893.1 helix-turn-helix transcriptional regulator [Clostridia bacterium]